MAWFRKKVDEVKESQVFVVMGNGFEGTAPPSVDFAKLSKESYMKNVIAFRCIDLIAKSVASVDWALYQEDASGKEERVLKHPVLDVLYRPNPREGLPTFMEKMMAYFLINGNTYIERVKLTAGQKGGTAKEMYVHRPDRIEILKKGLTVIAYQYKYGSEKVVWPVDPITGVSDLLHIKTFSPNDDFYGWGITMSAASEIDNSNFSSEWNRSMFKNGARPGTLITLSKRLSPEQYERFKEQLESKYTGAGNAGKTMVLDNVDASKGDINVTPWGWSPREMDFNESENKMARRIAFSYGVPPQLVGIPGDNTYSNYKEARESFWEDTVSWYLQLIAGELTNWLLADTGLYLKPLLDDSPAMEAAKAKRLETAQKSEFLTINEKRTLAGFEPIAGGDVLLVSASMLPFTGDDIDEDAGDEQQQEDEQEVEKFSNPYQDYE